MSRFREGPCPPSVMIIVAMVAATGVFLAISNLAEQHRGSRTGFEALLLVPLLLCSMLAAKANRS